MTQTKIALLYDFDGTLSPGNMQEHSFIPSLGISKDVFWREVTALAKDNDIDNILSYMHLMLCKASDNNKPITKEILRKHAETIPFFPGVTEWFNTINAYNSDVTVQHYIVSSGLREMIHGTAIGKCFTRVFACDFIYDENDRAVAAGLSVNYTNKTQFLFRISKGAHEISDMQTVNKLMTEDEKPIPFSRMVYIGDGETDIPCFKVLADNGGHGIVVYNPESENPPGIVSELLKDGRVRHAAPADFRENGKLMNIVKELITLMHTESRLSGMGGI